MLASSTTDKSCRPLNPDSLQRSMQMCALDVVLTVVGCFCRSYAIICGLIWAFGRACTSSDFVNALDGPSGCTQLVLCTDQEKPPKIVHMFIKHKHKGCVHALRLSGHIRSGTSTAYVSCRLGSAASRRRDGHKGCACRRCAMQCKAQGVLSLAPGPPPITTRRPQCLGKHFSWGPLDYNTGIQVLEKDELCACCLTMARCPLERPP